MVNRADPEVTQKLDLAGRGISPVTALCPGGFGGGLSTPDRHGAHTETKLDLKREHAEPMV